MTTVTISASSVPRRQTPAFAASEICNKLPASIVTESMEVLQNNCPKNDNRFRGKFWRYNFLQNHFLNKKCPSHDWLNVLTVSHQVAIGRNSDLEVFRPMGQVLHAERSTAKVERSTAQAVRAAATIKAAKRSTAKAERATSYSERSTAYAIRSTANAIRCTANCNGLRDDDRLRYWNGHRPVDSDGNGMGHSNGNGARNRDGNRMRDGIRNWSIDGNRNVFLDFYGVRLRHRYGVRSGN
ncbi:unnamed protein product [Nesidiocoris tenuis]|uniref:Uncharacterized protein n=1 Tax=Nesidiocoris tenuis TaxID=355587 RepID=A0A6H5GWZ4_9HEMI|nr:unnamed protein product [Nesidiocoris tenuis]CAB0007485.1 unnamed protein product [Nesidiocoris tenuis]